MAKKIIKSKAKSPKLFKRGAAGIFHFRLRVDGKDKWFSTKTNDLQKAKDIAISAAEGQRGAPMVAKTEKTAVKIARKLSDSIVKSITGQTVPSIKIDEAQAKWASLSQKHGDLTPTTQKFYNSVFARFERWCKAKGLTHVDEVTEALAIEYAKGLWESKLTPKTFNEHIAHLSRVFSKLDKICPLPQRNPFDRDKVERIEKSEMETASHKPLELDQVTALIKKAASHGPDLRDLFVLGHQTGARLKDLALLQWGQIEDDFINVIPYKTKRTNNTARIPISSLVRSIFAARRPAYYDEKAYVLPKIADQYIRDPGSLAVRLRNIFESVLGEKETHQAAGKHRKKNTSVYSFHSFRVTYMSLLARRDVSIRDAMRIMGWKSMEMVKLYERELEKAKMDADKRTLKLVQEIEEFAIDLPEAKEKASRLLPTKDAMEWLCSNYSNIAIGRIYDMTEAAIRKWMNKLEVIRTKRIESSDLKAQDIARIRAKLQARDFIVKSDQQA